MYCITIRLIMYECLYLHLHRGYHHMQLVIGIDLQEHIAVKGQGMKEERTTKERMGEE